MCTYGQVHLTHYQLLRTKKHSFRGPILSGTDCPIAELRSHTASPQTPVEDGPTRRSGGSGGRTFGLEIDILAKEESRTAPGQVPRCPDILV